VDRLKKGGKLGSKLDEDTERNAGGKTEEKERDWKEEKLSNPKKKFGPGRTKWKEVWGTIHSRE